MKTLSVEEAVAWVTRNARTIGGHSLKYLTYAPYGQEDYLQDAYEAAIIAARVSAERNIPFQACFWVTFKGRLAAVTPHPESAHHGGSASPPSNFCRVSDFGCLVTDSPDPSRRVDMDRLFKVLKKHLRPDELRILSLVVGVNGGRLGIRETSRKLKCTPANIRQRLKYIYGKLSELSRQGKLVVDFRELCGESHRPGRKKPAGRSLKMARAA